MTLIAVVALLHVDGVRLMEMDGGDGEMGTKQKLALARSLEMGPPRSESLTLLARGCLLAPAAWLQATSYTSHSPSPRRIDVHLLIDQLTKSSTTTLQSYPITLADWPNNHQSGSAVELQSSFAKVNRDLDQSRPTFRKRSTEDIQIIRSLSSIYLPPPPGSAKRDRTSELSPRYLGAPLRRNRGGPSIYRSS